jgi:type I restriction enzyme S subunit
MTDWHNCKLGDLLQIKHGFAFLGEHFTSAGTHVVLTPGNFLEEGGFKENADKAKWYSGPIPDAYVLSEGDLIVAMTEQAEGLLGSSALIPRSGVYLHNQRLGLVQIRDQTQADQHFIYYLFNTKPVRQQIRGSASGTKIRHTAPSRIADVKVSVPPLPIQQRIAGILSAYDELIENSQRRIKILESMARTLYREWFVHFRFPGHEQHPRVASPLGEIPQGWEVKKLKDVCQLTMGQSPKSEFYNEVGDGEPFHQGVTNFGDRFPTDRLFCTAAGRIAEAGDILFSVRAPVGRMNIANKKIILGRGLSAIRHNDDCQAFLWEQLRNHFTKEDMMGNGAIFASVTKDDMQGIELMCPPSSIVNTATKHFEPLHSEIATLSQKIQNLRRTRDLLLPRLLSGQINVETSA